MATYVTRTLKNGTVRHRVEFRDGGRSGPPIRKVFDDEPTARRFKKLVEAHRNRMPDDETLRRAGFGFLLTELEAAPAVDLIRLVDYADRYVDTLDECSKLHRQKLKSMIRDHLAEHFEDKDIRAITRGDLREWQRWMTDVKELSPKTVRNVRGLLVPMFNAACERQDDNGPAILQFSPIAGLKPPKKDPYYREILTTVDHVRIVFDAARQIDPYAADLLFVAACVAMRWSEIVALMPDACYLGAARPFVIARRKAVWEAGKGWHLADGAKSEDGQFRRLPLFTEVGQVIAPRVAATSSGGLIFGRPSDGEIWHHGCFYRDRWQPIVELARKNGLPHDLTIHGLRKSTLSLLAEKEVDPVTLREFAGHASPVTTLKLYSSPTGRGHGKVVDALGDFYGGAVA